MLSIILRQRALFAALAFSLCASSCSTVERADAPPPRDRWTAEQANAWYASQPWLVGCNFTTSTAINQLEMWQADTFDLATIDRELGWASDLGFNTLRVYLHDLLWTEDSEGFLERVDVFLGIAAKHDIRIMLVPLDGVWDPHPKPGKQPEPRPHLHNSGWVQSPGAEILGDPARHDELEPYIKGLISRFATDDRVLAWDLFNEPDNDNRNSYGDRELPNKAELALALQRKVFRWARECGPSQPLTVGVWHSEWADLNTVPEIVRNSLEESDVISFHAYSNAETVRARIAELEKLGRPILCTEYMARPVDSTFESILPIFKEHKIAAYNWGFVAGKSQTIYPWDSWLREYTAEPELWFHDILRPDGTAYIEEEVATIRKLTDR